VEHQQQCIHSLISASGGLKIFARISTKYYFTTPPIIRNTIPRLQDEDKERHCRWRSSSIIEIRSIQSVPEVVVEDALMNAWILRGTHRLLSGRSG